MKKVSSVRLITIIVPSHEWGDWSYSGGARCFQGGWTGEGDKSWVKKTAGKKKQDGRAFGYSFGRRSKCK